MALEDIERFTQFYKEIELEKVHSFCINFDQSDNLMGDD